MFKDINTPLKRNFEQIEEETDKVVDLKLLTGGKGSGDGNWLSELDIGTAFLIQEKTGQDFVLGQFTLAGKTERAVVLVSPNTPGPIFVNPVRFCGRYNQYEILGIISNEDTKGSTLDISDVSEEPK